MSAFAHLLIYIGTLALALGTFAWRLSRAMLLYKAGSTALTKGSQDPQGKAGLKIVDKLTSQPWYRALLPWRKSDDGSL